VQTKTRVRIFGLLLIVIGLACNRWLLAFLFSPDNHITNELSHWIIYIFQAGCVGFGIYLVSKPQIVESLPTHISFPLRWDVLVSCTCALLLMIIFAFGYGVAVGRAEFYPWDVVSRLKRVAVATEARISFACSDMPEGNKAAKWSVHNYAVPEDEGAGVVLNKRKAVCPGYTLFSDWSPTAKLINTQGKVLHSWHKAFPRNKNQDSGGQEKFWGKVHVYPNGSLLAIYHGSGDDLSGENQGPLIKLDVNSQVEWVVDTNAHHDLDVGSRGKIYVLSASYTSGESYELRRDKLKILHPSGEIIRTVSLLKAMQRSAYEHYLPKKIEGDVLHANNVEVLSGEIAQDFTDFRENDILLSFRNIHTIAVMDGRSYEIKWALRGLTSMQHDPDFIPGGRILIFDNLYTPAKRTIRSRVVEYDMSKGKPTWSYSSDHFFTEIRGSQQLLPNGNVLITETNAGTIFEVTRAGEIVWKYRSVNQADRFFGDGQFIGLLKWARKYRRDYFTKSFQKEFIN